MELAAEILRDFGELRFRACGGSMLPAIFPGDILLIRRDPIGRIRQGHTVLSLRAGLFCAHRVVRVENRGTAVRLITRGDALTTQDPAVSEDEYLGRVMGLHRGRKQREVGDRPSLESRVLGWVLRRSDFLTISLMRWHSLCMRLSGKAKPAGPGNREIAAGLLR
ncbi:MAG TPA: S24/S26 family peptidase [Candidatus Sulfotelmatobacter sp.]|nr:S24/S26 family peptidase [Candidatus Sulfotelmatobacter sp.]